MPNEVERFRLRGVPSPGVGAALLDRVHAFLGRFVAYPSPETRVAHTLWIAHAHLMGAWNATPRIAFLSPEPSSGKTRALEVTATLVPRPVVAANVTTAYIIRKAADQPTILLDEVDTVFGPRVKDNHEELRGLINAGYRKGAVSGRCVMRGKLVETEEIPAYCAVAIAGLGKLPDSIMSRSVIVPMRPRLLSETVEPYDCDEHEPQGHQLRDQIAEWSDDIAVIINTRPELPQTIVDRDADVWRPLVAVADAAGGDWPDRARVTAVTLVTVLRDNARSLGKQLLSDLKAIFGDDDHRTTEDLLAELHKLDESPWGDLKGKPLDPRRLARLLREYDVRPKTVRIGTSTAKGYRREDLLEPWERYLSVPSQKVTADTSVTSGDNAAPPDKQENSPLPHETAGEEIRATITEHGPPPGRAMQDGSTQKGSCDEPDA